MANLEQKIPYKEFEQNCVNTIAQIRSEAWQILNKAGERHAGVSWWEKDYLEFDSSQYSRLALINRAAAECEVVPLITITSTAKLELMSPMRVLLTAKDTRKAAKVDIITIELPKNSNNPLKTKVILHTVPLPNRIFFREVMDSNYYELVDTTIKSLQAINNYLNARS